MPRKVIPLITGEIYHLYNRGVDRRPIFQDTDDYLRFYTSLMYFNVQKPSINYYEARRTYRDGAVTKKLVKIHAYSLLPNHFHLLVTQHLDSGISEFMKRISGGYTIYFNEKYERTGSLFQGTFKRSHVSKGAQLNHLAAYVNHNHIIHDVPSNSELYYTSSGVYEGTKKNTFLDTQLITSLHTDVKSFADDSRQYAMSIAQQRKEQKNIDQAFLE